MPEVNAKSKIGRNAPCPCGSGLKYKKCCSEADQTRAAAKPQAQRLTVRKLSGVESLHPDIVKARQGVETQQAATGIRLREEYGVWINYVAPVNFQGRKVWGIGSRIYTNRPPNETFHEFLLQVLRETFGEEWRATQARLLARDQHFAMRCFNEYKAWTAEFSAIERPQDGVWSASPNGWAQYLRSLAWDVATLIHASTGGVPDALVARLRDPVAFQGARYELAIAAIFARLDCQIRFLDEDETLQGKKRVEFVARHRPSGQEIAVEAKSRHRKGVIHEEGEADENNPLRGDARGVRGLFVKALKKGVEGMPYLIFIDVNAPAEPEAAGFDKQWQREVRRWMDRFPIPTAESPEAYNALYVTNFSPQYDASDLALPGEWLGARPLFTQTPAEFDVTGMLEHALNNYERVPEIDLGGQLRV